MLITALFIILFIAKQIMARLANKSMITSILTSEEGSEDLKEERSSEDAVRLLGGRQEGRLFKGLNICTSIFFYLFWLTCALMFLVFYMFGYFGRSTGIDVLTVLALTLIVTAPTLIWKYLTKSR